jgi:hypothetical protein
MQLPGDGLSTVQEGVCDVCLWCRGIGWQPRTPMGNLLMHIGSSGQASRERNDES